MKKTSQYVVDDIQNKILNGELKAYDMLPSEREMTVEYNISRPLLREALKALESMGLITRHQGKGNFVSNRTGEALARTVILSFKLENGQPQDILDLRYMIESYTVPKAARKATEEDISELKKLHRMMMEEPDFRVKSKLDRSLHYKIAKIADNQLVMSILDQASHLLDTFTDETIRISPFAGNSINNIYNEHAEIIDAIAEHDAERAFSAIEIHLSHVNIRLMQY